MWPVCTPSPVSSHSERRLLDPSLSQEFGLPWPPPDRLSAVLNDLDDRARTEGMSGWIIGPVRGEAWAWSAHMPHPATEVDLALRPVPLQGWDGVWQASIDLGIDCACPVDHNMHHVRRLEAQALFTALPTAVRELIAAAKSWTGNGQDATWWRQHADLP